MENKKKLKKKWNRPVITSTLSIKKTFAVLGTTGRDLGMGATMYTS
jgi:hypothetical protein